MYICIHIYVYIFANISVYTPILTYTQVYISMYILLKIYISIFTCILTYIHHIFVHTYRSIFIYRVTKIYIYLCSPMYTSLCNISKIIFTYYQLLSNVHYPCIFLSYLLSASLLLLLDILSLPGSARHAPGRKFSKIGHDYRKQFAYRTCW